MKKEQIFSEFSYELVPWELLPATGRNYSRDDIPPNEIDVI